MEKKILQWQTAKILEHSDTFQKSQRVRTSLNKLQGNYGGGSKQRQRPSLKQVINYLHLLGQWEYKLIWEGVHISYNIKSREEI